MLFGSEVLAQLEQLGIYVPSFQKRQILAALGAPALPRLPQELSFALAARPAKGGRS